MRRSCVVRRRDEIHLYEIFVRKFKSKRLLGGPGRRWEEIKVDFKWGVRVWSGFIGFSCGFLRTLIELISGFHRASLQSITLLAD